MLNTLVNVNGEILKATDAKVSVFDRGYLYGDSLYEVMRSYHGIFYLIDEHLTRLENSAKLCRMVLAQTTTQFKEEIYKTLEAFRKLPGQAKTEAYCRIIVSRGVGKIGFGLNCLTTPSQFVIIVQPIAPPSSADFERGLKLKVSERLRNDRRALDPAMKSGNYLNSLLAYLEASAQDFDDALLCNTDGHVTEGTTFNVFYVRKGVIATPPLDIGILDGTTRRKLFALVRKEGFEYREVRFPKERMLEADEVFITSTIKEVFPVTQVDGKTIAKGKAGPITRKLAQLYKDAVEEALRK